MAYVKNTWVDREGQTRYHETIDDDGALIFTPDYEKVTEIGTPVNADNMNHIEDGIVDHENRITVLEEAGDASNFLNKSQITNCLLEVPQNIKLELNNGTLTLKAGSKVIVPNGFEADGTTPKFNEIIMSQDKVIAPTGGSGTCLVSISSDGNSYSSASSTNNCVSGAGVTHKNYGLCYDTSTNIINRWGADTILFQSTLPFAQVTQTDGVITSIDQVFNGMGYIGSTVWVDKGVKGLIPNGRNENGSLRNIEYITNQINILNLSNATRQNANLFLGHNELNNNGGTGYYIGLDKDKPKTTPSSGKLYYYATDTNYFYYSNSSTTTPQWVKYNYMYVGNFYTVLDSGITSFQPKLPFRAVDYNDALLKSDKSEILSWGMPSTKKISLTAGASGSKYTAPANGYFVVQSNNVSGELGLWNTTAYIGMKVMSTNNKNMDVFVPTQKSDIVIISYVSTTIKNFAFVYAQGEV